MFSIDTVPFPEDVPTHPLLIVDFQLIKEEDEAELDKLWKAATQLGFWYLKNHGADAEVDGMYELGEEFMNLPIEVRMQYNQGDNGLSLGYKARGTNVIDEKGTRDSSEFLNISKDDALAYPTVVHRTYPPLVIARMDSLIRPFVEKSVEVNSTLMKALNRKLALPEGTLQRLHDPQRKSLCAARAIRASPREEAEALNPMLAAHTDFGSLSFLHNRLGGLQVLAPGTRQWQYVKPLPGHAICNVGDSLHIFSGGVLRSNMHRVIAPPGAEKTDRYSVVFFTRANDEIELRALADQSTQIAAAVTEIPNAQARFWPGVTAREWLERRVRNQRLKNFKGPESFRNWIGTEDITRLAKAGDESAGIRDRRGEVPRKF